MTLKFETKQKQKSQSIPGQQRWEVNIKFLQVQEVYLQFSHMLLGFYSL